MAADFHIHVLTGEPVTIEFKGKQYSAVIDENILATFFANSVGSKYEVPPDEYMFTYEECDMAAALIAMTPSVWVGEVSWLKAELFEDDGFIPSPIMKISEIIGEDLPVIDDELIEKISKALDEENKTRYRLNNKKEILDFLRQHKGRRCFTVSW